jgi:fumarate hydratase, class I
LTSYRHTPLFPLGPDETPYRKLKAGGVRGETMMGREVLVIEREALRVPAEAAYSDVKVS